jgi:7-cyano-7-deazaguanine synthase
MRDVYAATHWSVTGQAPAYHTPDEDVYLPGRNIILLSKAAVFCAATGVDISRIVIGTLDHNPFPDATPAFRESIAKTLSLGLAHTLTVDAPYANSSKADVIRKGIALGVPFEHTLSCMKPAGGQHCGTCSKCRERHDAFLEAGVPDPTTCESLQLFAPLAA